MDHMDSDDEFWVAASQQADAAEQHIVASQSQSQQRPQPVDDDDDAFWAEASQHAAVTEQGRSAQQQRSPGSVLRSGIGLTRGAEWDAIMETELERGELLKLVAFAGAGKSTVLREYARRRQHLKILYLTFGKQTQQDKRDEFNQVGLQHVTVVTVHSLANGATKRYKRPGRKGPVNDLFLRPADLEKFAGPPQFSQDWNYGHVSAVKYTLDVFAASVDRELSAAHVPDDLERGVYRSDVLRAAKRVWADVHSLAGTLPICHGHYPKIFQLDRDLQTQALRGFDLVLLDEAHDCTPAQIDMIGSTDAPARIIVYDPHQAIYSFRHAHAIELLRSLACVATLPISQVSNLAHVLGQEL